MAKGTEWGKLSKEWEAEKRRHGGIHPHMAADVIVAAAMSESKAGRLPRYLYDLRDTLNRLFPKKGRE